MNGNNLNDLNSNTSANINTSANTPFHVPGAAPVANYDTPEDSNAFSHANNDTPENINMLFHVPGAAPVTNVDTPENSNAFSHANDDTPQDVNNPSLNQKAKTRKRKSDEADLVLPDGTRRIRKKKGRPDDNIPVSSKRAKKK
jgi:hypothetical protein